MRYVSGKTPKADTTEPRVRVAFITCTLKLVLYNHWYTSYQMAKHINNYTTITAYRAHKATLRFRFSITTAKIRTAYDLPPAGLVTFSLSQDMSTPLPRRLSIV